LINKYLMDVNDLKKEYPRLTSWLINKSIKEYNMPVIFLGRKRYFRKDSIELWLKNLEEVRCYVKK